MPLIYFYPLASYAMFQCSSNLPIMLKNKNCGQSVLCYYLCTSFLKQLAACQARNQGGSRGSNEPPILISFLLKPALCISTQQ